MVDQVWFVKRSPREKRKVQRERKRKGLKVSIRGRKKRTRA